VNRIGFREFQKKYYESWAKSYDKHPYPGALTKRDNLNTIKRIERLLNILDLPPDEVVLEIAIGTGIQAKGILNRTKNNRFIGLDLSFQMLKVAQNRLRKFGESVTLIQGDGELLPFKENSFKYIFSAGILHHSDNRVKILSEIYKILVPGGCFVAMEPNRLHPINIYAGLISKEERKVLSISPKNLERWFNNAGFKKPTIDGFLYTPPYPIALDKFYDLINKTFENIVILKRLSINFFVVAHK